MPVVQSCLCPHCAHTIEEADPVDYMTVAGAGGGVYVLVCPRCRKPIGAYSKSA
jgi:hypothetical protein